MSFPVLWNGGQYNKVKQFYQMKAGMKRIFFVKDDVSLRGRLTFALEKQGYAVTAAPTQAEAESL